MQRPPWLALVLLLAACQAAPVEPPVEAPVEPPVEPPVPDGWTLHVRPYLFASGLEGTVGNDVVATEVEADFDELFDSLDLGGMLSVELVPPGARWSLLSDWQYVELEEEGTAPGPLMTPIDATFDPLVGVRSRLAIGERVALHLRGDIGGFGAGSDFAWSAAGVFAWSVAETVDALAGYRHLAVDYDDDLIYDVELAGPLLGVGLRF